MPLENFSTLSALFFVKTAEHFRIKREKLSEQQ